MFSTVLYFVIFKLPTMKISVMLTLFLLAITGMNFAQDINQQPRLLIGDAVPSFTAESTQGTITFPVDYGRKWKILFSHPADFTPVCSSEILELAAEQKEFEKLGARIAVVSTDPLDKHYSWKKSLETVRYNGNEPVKINFPLIDDQSKSVARSYGMLRNENPSSKDVRGVFIINPHDKLEAVFFYPNNVGRNIAEIKRTLIALQTADTYTVLTPANWQPGAPVMVPYLNSTDEARVESENYNPNVYPLTWYMIFKQLDEK